MSRWILPAWQGPCQDLQLDSVPCFPLDLAVFPLAVQSRVKLWDLWKQFSLFCWLQNRSEQYQQSEAHSNKLFMKDSLRCLQREKQSAKLCFSTDHGDVKDTRGRQTIGVYFILWVLNKLYTLDTCRHSNWHVNRIRIFFSGHTATMRACPWLFKPSHQPCDSLFGFKASSIAKITLYNLVSLK